MFQGVSVLSQPKSPRARRSVRLICVAAVAGGVAVSFGAAEARILDDHGSTSISATPEDPCLLHQNCGLQNQIVQEVQQGNNFQAYCDELKLRNVRIPECDPGQPAPPAPPAS